MKSCRRWAGAKKVSKLLSTALCRWFEWRSLDKRLELVKFTKNTIDSLVDKVRHESIATHRCTSDLKSLVSRYPMECCGVVMPKAKEYILARSRSSQRKSYVSILLSNGVDGSNNIVRLTTNVSVVRDQENGYGGWRREAALVHRDCPRLKKALNILPPWGTPSCMI